MRRNLLFSMIIGALVIFSPSAFAQSISDAHRIVQPITVNGESASGVLLVRDGAVQTVSCDSPQPYQTADHAESGWACYDSGTGMWLLHAEAPSSASSSAPAVIYNQPSTVYVPSYSYTYPYAYPYYPYYPYSYGYPFFWGPTFGLGFGFNFGHGFHDGHEFHGGHFAHGGFNHSGNGFAHVGPAFHGGGGFAHGGGGFAHGAGGFHGGGGGFHGGAGFHGGGFGGHMGGGGGGHR